MTIVNIRLVQSIEIVVVIQFVHEYIYIRFVGTHDEYDKTDCKTI